MRNSINSVRNERGCVYRDGGADVKKKLTFLSTFIVLPVTFVQNKNKQKQKLGQMSQEEQCRSILSRSSPLHPYAYSTSANNGDR